MADSKITYWTLVDSNGDSWYVYPGIGNALTELVISDIQPTGVENGEWKPLEYVFEPSTNPSTAASGIVYLTMVNVSGDTRYIYPNTSGELVIDTEEPS
jgi:hypothetical protein